MRSKSLTLIGIAFASTGALLTVTQVWVVLELSAGTAAFDRIEATGHQINASLTPLALAALASALVLTIAGPVFRRVLGVLLVLLGAGMSAISFTALSNPWAAASGQLGEATGLIGLSASDAVTEIATAPFVLLTLICGAALIVLGLVVLVVSGGWRAAGRKYQSAESPRTAGGGGDEPDRVSDWDSLSHGDDPSDRTQHALGGDEPSENSQGAPGNG